MHGGPKRIESLRLSTPFAKEKVIDTEGYVVVEPSVGGNLDPYLDYLPTNMKNFLSLYLFLELILENR